MTRNTPVLGGLILENFKAFGARQAIPFAPITLIFGPNGAGKSSIIQSLLLLKQSMLDTHSPDDLLVPQGSLVDLGSPLDLVFKKEPNSTFEITPLMNVPTADESLESHLLYRAKAPEGLPIGIGVRTHYSTKTKRLELQSLPAYIGNEAAYALQGTESPRDSGINRARPGRASLQRHFADFGELFDTHPVWKELYQAFQDNLPEAQTILENLLVSIDLVNHPKGEWSNSANHLFDSALVSELIKRFSEYRFESYLNDIRSSAAHCSFELDQFSLMHSCHQWRGPELRSYLLRMLEPDYAASEADYESSARSRIPNLGDLSTTLWESLRHFLDQLIFLGPLREYPARHRVTAGLVAADLDKSGRLTWDVLAKDEQLIAQTNRRLNAFGTGFALQVDRLKFEPLKQTSGSKRNRQPEPIPMYAVRLIDERTGTPVNIRDVGFGVSQLIPVIVQSEIARNRTLIIEQPELHLHPRLQSHLGTLFRDGIRPPHNNQYIIETHSQHVILRLQRHVREGDLTPSDISVIYVERDGTGSNCQYLPLDVDGEFTVEWPHGFFEETYREMFGLDGDR